MKKASVRDPDLGTIEVPAGEAWTETAIDKLARELAARHRGRRVWKPGRSYKCPACGTRTLRARDDLTYEAPKDGRLYVFPHLRGARCDTCGGQSLEADDQDLVETVLGVGLRVRSDYEAKVSKIGSGSLGTYWPRDIERLMGLRPDKRVLIEIVGPNEVLVRFQDPA